ncbi:MAG: UDP-4-amino-4,6-dideoxy-N-acetyl-beta-L-altrosamine transaminase [bacterium]|nr:UDP-4-amino-4,6-dideoxy-N-acetyl-beta-L-altrosamine transaminase [bacterium]
MIPYSHQSIDKDDVAAVVRVLKSDFLTQGPKVKEFEEVLAKKTGAKFAVAFSSGTAALEAAFAAAGIQKGDEIITSPLTFAATTNAVLWTGAKVVFADVEAETGTLDPAMVARKITSRTKVIVPVDYAGFPAHLHELRKLAKRHGLIFIEDAAHSLGAVYRGRRIGGLSDMTMFSFHPVKSITTGEGGAITTNNKKYLAKLIRFREHGITKDTHLFVRKNQGDWYHEMQELGHNYRLTDLQAALGLSQLNKLERFIKARRALAEHYTEAFAHNPNLIPPVEGRDRQSSWHLYPLRLAKRLVPKRAEIFRKLRQRGIGVQVHYIPVYLHPYYQKLGYKKGLCQNAEAFYEAEVSIPLYPDLSRKDQDFVIKTIHELTEL